MAQKQSLNIPLNRVEGDLELKVEIEDGVVVDARCAGVLFRGFENILVGRGSLDGLVITPRICGICTTAHLHAAAAALDAITGLKVPSRAVMVRNLALMAENVQSDARHFVLMFAVDFTNPAYKGSPLYGEAVRRYQPMRGDVVAEAVRETAKMVDLVGILGGRWPHSAFITPGGITGIASRADLLQCRQILARYRGWYERRILGCCLERWLEVKTRNDLVEWLAETAEQRDSELGFFLRFAGETGLESIGAGHGNFLSFGSLPLPAETAVKAPDGNGHLVPAGFISEFELHPFDQQQVTEYVTHSWYEDYGEGRHPYQGVTVPHATGEEGRKYSWAKAPRYKDTPCETGPLAEMLAIRNPLFVDLVQHHGSGVLVRQLARVVRAASWMQVMQTWLEEVSRPGEFFTPPGEIEEGEGCGVIQAARGALGHWVKIKDQKIEHYQIITPTAWNASPRDGNEVRGPLEEAVMGTEVKDLDNPVELGHVVRSFDPCLVCTVHTLRRGKTVSRRRLRAC
jgi:hydrogenase large subunit